MAMIYYDSNDPHSCVACGEVINADEPKVVIGMLATVYTIHPECLISELTP